MRQMGKSAETMNFYTFCTTVYGLNHPSDSDKNVWQINLIHGKNRMILYMNGMSNSQAAKHWLFLPRNENERIYASLADTSSTATKAIVFYKSHFWNPT